MRKFFEILECTIEILLEALMFIRTSTFHGDRGRHLLEATRARKSVKHPASAISR